MGISIHIEDVAKEPPEALLQAGVFLLKMADEAGVDVRAGLPSDWHGQTRLGVIRPSIEVPTPPVAEVPTPPVAEVPTPPVAEVLTPPVADLKSVFGAGAVPPAPVTHGTELDARGFPWDARIHGRTKAKIGDGTWRYRRGSTDDEIAMVEAKLRQVMGAPAAAALAAAAPVTPPPAAAPVTPPPPAAPVTPPPAAAPAGNAFSDFMAYVIRNVTESKIKQTQVAEIVNGLGLPHVGALFTRQDLIPAVLDKVNAIIEGGAQ